MKNLIENLERGHLFCKATDIAKTLNMDPTQIRGMAVHIPEQLPFNSFVIGKNIKFSSLSVIQSITGINLTTGELINRCFGKFLCEKMYFTPAQASKILNCDPNTLRAQAVHSPQNLGFPVIVSGSHIKIPILPFLSAITALPEEKLIKVIGTDLSAPIFFLFIQLFSLYSYLFF